MHTLPCLTPKPKHKYFVNTYLLGIAFTKWIQERINQNCMLRMIQVP